MHLTLFTTGPRNWRFMLLLVAAVVASERATADPAPAPIAETLAVADPSRGKRLFLQCQGCHVSKPGAGHTIGPNLWGVVGRPVGSQAGFSYSDGLKAIGGTWDYGRLSQYLYDPKSLAPDTRMLFAGIAGTQDRADLIAYLRTLSDDPPALPKPSLVESERPQARAATQPAREQDWQGLPAGPGREEVFYACNSCHSLMLVKQQGMSRESWDETLEWMVEEQGMAEIEDAATRDLILDYLSTHFGSG